MEENGLRNIDDETYDYEEYDGDYYSGDYDHDDDDDDHYGYIPRHGVEGDRTPVLHYDEYSDPVTFDVESE